MKRHLFLGVSLVSLAAASPAMAQPAPTLFNWTGFYAGMNAGYSAGHGAFSYNEPAFGCCGLPTQINQSHQMNGGVIGFQGGYNVQAGFWVMGVETDFDWTGQKGSSNSNYNYPGGFEGATTNLSVAVRARLDWLGTTRVRAGWLFTPTTMAYGTAGLAYGRVSVAGTVTDTSCTPSCTWSFGNGQTAAGYAVGAGIEGAILGSTKWTWRVEYLYINLGSTGGSGFDTDFGGAYSWSEKITDNIVRVGFNLKIP